MIDDRTLTKEENARRADRASQLLADPLMLEAFANLKITYFEEWVNSGREATASREALYHAAAALGHVENHLRIVAGRGPIEKSLESLKKTQPVRQTLRRAAETSQF